MVETGRLKWMRRFWSSEEAMPGWRWRWVICLKAGVDNNMRGWSEKLLLYRLWGGAEDLDIPQRPMLPIPSTLRIHTL